MPSVVSQRYQCWLSLLLCQQVCCVAAQQPINLALICPFAVAAKIPDRLLFFLGGAST